MEGDPAALKMEYPDIIISDVRTTNGLEFSDKSYFLFSERLPACRKLKILGVFNDIFLG